MGNTQETHRPQATGGSRSAEQVSKSRDEQKNRDFNLTDEEKADIASDINIPKEQVANLKDLGAASGRDDYAGGSGDGMSNVSTNESTDLL